MVARRFRLDAYGNLHADRLFCRPFYCDPSLRVEARGWKSKKIVENREAKAGAMLAFESALARGDEGEAFKLARQVHVLMLAQRLIKPPKRVAARATA